MNPLMHLRKWIRASYSSFDSWVQGGLLVVALACFLSLGIANAFRGPASADDAWIALTAKNVALGKGYATSLSNNELLHFDPFISTGPALVLPAALSIAVFGNLHWVPGATQFFCFIVLFAMTARLLAAELGWRTSFPFLTTLTLLLTLASAKNWYFGALLGEPIAFAWILFGLVILSGTNDREKHPSAIVEYWHTHWTALFAGIFFSFAILAKQIAIFSVSGVICAWFSMGLMDRNCGTELAKRTFFLLLGVFSATVCFEGVKIYQLGVDGYAKAIEATLRAAVATEGGSGFTDRLERFIDVSFDSYVRPILVPLVLLSLSFLARALQKSPNRERTFGIRLTCLAATGAAFHLVYVLLFSELWARYLWLGVGFVFVALSAALLDATRTRRLTLSLALIVSFWAGGCVGVVSELQDRLYSDPTAVERKEVVNFLSHRLDIPYAAEYWSSIYDLVFEMEHEGEWRFGPRISDLRWKKFTAVVNNIHTNKASFFYRTVKNTCQPLKKTQMFELFQCDDLFWHSYRV